MRLLVNARVRSWNYRVFRLLVILALILTLLFLAGNSLFSSRPPLVSQPPKKVSQKSVSKQGVLVEQPVDIPELDLSPAQPRPKEREKTPVQKPASNIAQDTQDKEDQPAEDTPPKKILKEDAPPQLRKPNVLENDKEHQASPSTPLAKAPPKLKKPLSEETEEDWKEKRDAVVKTFRHAWKGYKTYAFGSDELLPIAKKGRVWFNLGLTIIDSLDTAWLMGEKKIFKEARDWVAGSYSLKQSTTASVFETNIRVLGGLLSTYALTNDKLFLKRATEVGNTLLKAFHPKSGIPYINFDFSRQSPQGYSTTLADCGTLSLEFKYLSHVTGDPKYWNAVQKISKTLLQAPNTNGLLHSWANVEPFAFTDQRISIGSGGDSYYEYLYKQFHQTSGKEPVFKDQWNDVLEGVRKYMLGISEKDHFLFIGELNGGIGSSLSQSMEHLACFFPGTLALSATGGKKAADIKMTPQQLRDLDLAEELTRTCFEMYKRVQTGLSPERVHWSSLSTNPSDKDGRAALEVLKRHQSPLTNKDKRSTRKSLYADYEGTHERHPDFRSHFDISSPKDFDIQDSRNMLRPETIESLFILYRITGNQEYRLMGWEIFQAFERWTKVETGGYTELSDVDRIPPPRGDKMETFFLGETLKYFYLLFSEESLVPLDEFVFNTEAHPLPIFKVDPQLERKLTWLSKNKR